MKIKPSVGSVFDASTLQLFFSLPNVQVFRSGKYCAGSFMTMSVKARKLNSVSNCDIYDTRDHQKAHFLRFNNIFRMANNFPRKNFFVVASLRASVLLLRFFVYPQRENTKRNFLFSMLLYFFFAQTHELLFLRSKFFLLPSLRKIHNNPVKNVFFFFFFPFFIASIFLKLLIESRRRDRVLAL